jgi:YHS domain-containing protein
MKGLRNTLTSGSVGMMILVTANGFGSSSDQTASRFSLYPATIAGLSSKVFLEEEKPGIPGKSNLDSDGVILKGFDAVAYFKEGKAVKGNPAITSTYQNAKFLFASATNKAEFDKDPAKFVPQFGGYCAYGVTVGVLADPEGPDAFFVYKGKLYICGNQGALRDFKNGIDDNIGKAEKNWLQLAAP